MSQNAQTPRRGRPPRIGLEAILDAASRLSREHGPRGVTMRAIAQTLEVDPAALYGHVDSKEALLRALSVRAAEQLTLPDPGQGDWDEACSRACQALRDELRRHPDLGLLDGNWDSLAPFNARATGVLIETLQRGPLAEEQIMPASQALLYLITSVARLEAGLAAAPVENARRYNERVLDALPGELGPAWSAFVMRPAQEAFDAIFTTGIEALLQGLTPRSAR